MEPNEGVYAYDNLSRTEVKSAKWPAEKKRNGREPAIKTDHDQALVRRRPRSLRRDELVGDEAKAHSQPT